MATIVEICNPFKPHEGSLRHDHVGGITVRQWLEENKPGLKEFSVPTICFVVERERKDVKKYLLRHEWETYVIKSNDDVVFSVVHGDPVTIFYAILVISIVASVILLLTMPKPVIPGQQQQADSIYSLNGQRNQNRLNNPVEQNYGRNRLYPSYAASAYTEYDGNDQYLYQLFCLGVGEYDISEPDALKIEDTPIENFSDIEYAFYEPSEEVTLFPDNVITSTEVGGIEMLGPNEAGTWVGPFAASDTGELANRIDIDIVFQNGLYVSNNDGSLGNNTVTGEWEYRVSGSSDPWIPLFNFSKTMNTSTPQRFTYKTNVTSGVYEVRGRRINDKDTNARSANTLTWQTLRAFLPSTKVYEGVTMLAVKAKATNNLNDNAANRINVIATRKLPIYDVNVPGPEVATRSIVWAFCDIALTGNTGMTIRQLDLTALRALDIIYEARGDTFDCMFADKMTVWDALKTCARAGRAVPMVSGSVLGMIRDYAKEFPSTIFNQENIVSESFQWEIKLPGTQDNDGIEIVYLDEDTFKDETLLCYFTGEAGEPAEDEPINAERIELRGITNRNQAYREGMYLWAQKRYQRTNLSVRTGMEGHIPTYGDMVGISHDLPRWATGGMVESVTFPSKVVQLSEPVTFGGGTHKIGFRTKNGSALGPFTVTAGTDEYHVVVSSLTDDNNATTGVDNLAIDDYSERPLFNFGAESVWSKYMVVVGINPTSDEEVALKLVNYDDRVFDYDEVDAPELPNVTNPPVIPSLPALTGLTVTAIPDSVSSVVVSWQPALGASAYVVQTAVTEQVTITGGAIEADDDVYTKVLHGRITGDPVKIVSMTGGTGLSIDTTYFFIRLTDDTGKFATTRVNAIAGTAIAVTLDASSVVLSTVPDEAVWNTIARTEALFYILPVSPGYLYVRVAGLNTARGAWAYAEGEVGIASGPPSAVQGLSLASPFIGTSANISWQFLAAATSYTVKVYQTSGMVLLDTYPDITGTFFSYTAALNTADCAALAIDVKRDLTFEVYAVNTAGTGPASTLGLIINPAPSAVVGMSSQLTAVKWSEKAIAAGTISGSGNARATITSTYVTGSPVNVDFAVTAGDTPAVWAPLARAAIALNAAIAAKFVISGTGTDIILTGKDGVFYDSTFNIALADSTSTGVTAAPTSTDISYNTYRLSWMVSPDSDIETYYVYASASSGFTPGGGNQIMDAMASAVDVNVTKIAGAHVAQYWRVGIEDKWGTEITLASEQTVSSYP